MSYYYLYLGSGRVTGRVTGLRVMYTVYTGQVDLGLGLVLHGIYSLGLGLGLGLGLYRLGLDLE